MSWIDQVKDLQVGVIALIVVFFGVVQIFNRVRGEIAEYSDYKFKLIRRRLDHLVQSGLGEGEEASFLREQLLSTVFVSNVKFKASPILRKRLISLIFEGKVSEISLVRAARGGFLREKECKLIIRIDNSVNLLNGILLGVFFLFPFFCFMYFGLALSSFQFGLLAFSVAIISALPFFLLIVWSWLIPYEAAKGLKSNPEFDSEINW